jgi:hypothetical protein
VQIVEARAPDSVTTQYWLPRTGAEASYRISDIRMLNLPDGPAALTARYLISLAGEDIEYEQPVVHRYVDSLYGERVRPFAAVPPVTAAFTEKTFLFPGAEPRDISVHLTAMAQGASGTARLNLPAGWTAAPSSVAFRFKDPLESAGFAFRVTPPAGERSAVAVIEAVVNGGTYNLAMTSISYPHIQTQTVFAPAEAKLVRADVKVLSRRIGYIMGSGDEIPRSLDQLGCEVTLLDSAALSQGSLARYDAIVTGVRAFNTRADLRANRNRLFDYVKQGGTLVVQYNVAGGFEAGRLEDPGPYPLQIGRERITVEESPVRFDPSHELLRQPNRIGPADFEGWVQERGLYFASAWDPRYETIFEMQDPGENPLKGGVLFARHGQGAYVFTALSFFRQLPAGVPGAYRIFANFVSAGKPGR